MQDALELLAHGGDRAAAQTGDLLQGVAQKQPISNVRLCRGKPIELTQHIVGKARGSFWIGDEQKQFGLVAAIAIQGQAAIRGQWRSHQLQGLLTVSAGQSERSRLPRLRAGERRERSGREKLLHARPGVGLLCGEHAFVDGKHIGGLLQQRPGSGVAVYHEPSPGQQKGGGGACVGHGLGTGQQLLGHVQYAMDLQRLAQVRQQKLEQSDAVLVHGSIFRRAPDAHRLKATHRECERDQRHVSNAKRLKTIAVEGCLQECCRRNDIVPGKYARAVLANQAQPKRVSPRKTLVIQLDRRRIDLAAIRMHREAATAVRADKHAEPASGVLRQQRKESLPLDGIQWRGIKNLEQL